jgi:hypothetical protein
MLLEIYIFTTCAGAALGALLASMQPDHDVVVTCRGMHWDTRNGQAALTIGRHGETAPVGRVRRALNGAAFGAVGGILAPAAIAAVPGLLVCATIALSQR